MASEVARATSQPPRGVSIQAFGIFSKIREIDALLRAGPTFGRRVIESHPEVAFWRLNGGQAMRAAEEDQGPGQSGRHGGAQHAALRGAALLRRLSWTSRRRAVRQPTTSSTPARCCSIAARHARGETRPFPDPPGVDAHGIPVAIMAER